MNIYCTYLTIYSGNKLPMFYIGSTTISKIENGYRGSVQSKEYKDIWKSEITHNSHLFKTIIITTHDNRRGAFVKEQKLQKALNVVSNTLYVNKMFAYPEFDGTANLGIKRTEKFKRHQSELRLGYTHSEETKSKMRKPKSPEHAAKIASANRVKAEKQIGSKRSDETKQKQRISSLGKPKEFNRSRVVVFDLLTNKYVKVSSEEYHQLKGRRYLTTTAYKKLRQSAL